MHKIIIKRAGIEYTGTLFESGLIELSNGHFSHIAHEVGMGREIYKEVDIVVPAIVTPEETISDKPKKRATKKA